MTKILFATPFKPYGIDSPFGRRDSFPEVLHNRLTRANGIFSYRGFFSAFGLHIIANNISAESDVLEYPTLARFKRQLKKGYDYVGIGSVVANLQKVRVMAEAVRELSPRSKIVIGGYCANIDDIKDMVPLDYLCIGEGIGFMRELLGDPPEFEFKNPDVFSRAHSVMGVPLFGKKNPHIVIGLGCPYGCEYCSPSHHFGRKYIRFFKTGDEIFREMERMEKKFRSRNFGFIGDDNFLMDQDRAEQLRECVVKSGKEYELFFFVSADKIAQFGARRLAELGANLVWIGRESCFLDHKKNQGVDLKALVNELQLHGIKVVVSTMLFMDQHTPENIWVDVEGHLELRPDFSMFTFAIGLPGTPHYDRLKEEGRLLRGFTYEDWNAISAMYSRHPLFTPAEARVIRQQVLDRDFHTLGPSVLRLIQTDLKAALYLRDSDREALRRRGRHFADKMSKYRAVLWALTRLCPTDEMRGLAADTLGEVERQFGPITRFEKTEGATLWALGLQQKARYALFGDVIQPPTSFTHYPGPR
jgi:radical SAM superfamily enzyme YgiQ (UPF0313 family)